MSANKVRNTFLFLLLGLLGVYGIYNSKHLFMGPSISITSPMEGAVLIDHVLRIEGVAKGTVYISINGRPITIDTSGAFSEEILLRSGYNDIVVYVRDRFRQTKEETLTVYLREAD